MQHITAIGECTVLGLAERLGKVIGFSRPYVWIRFFSNWRNGLHDVDFEYCMGAHSCGFFVTAQ